MGLFTATNVRSIVTRIEKRLFHVDDDGTGFILLLYKMLLRVLEMNWDDGSEVNAFLAEKLPPKTLMNKRLAASEGTTFRTRYRENWYQDKS